jgi:hypothetical protein
VADPISCGGCAPQIFAFVVVAAFNTFKLWVKRFNFLEAIKPNFFTLAPLLRFGFVTPG